MRPSPTARAAPVPARVAGIVGASLLLGTAAHVGGAGGRLPSLGAVLVTAALLVLLVAALVGAGRWVARRIGGERATLLEDGAALAALVLGQALVHASVGAATAATADAAHAHHHAAPMGTGALPPAIGHDSSWGMLAGHALAALLVGMLLRWLERGVLGILAWTAKCADAAARAGRTLPWSPVVLPAVHRCRLTPPLVRDTRPRLRVGFGAVVRRGPPMAPA